MGLSKLFISEKVAYTYDRASLYDIIKQLEDNANAAVVNGTATVANGATTAVVTHGLSVTPVLKDLSVTPTNNMGNATKFWISTPTSTQFTINVNTDPGATTATFVWTASIR
jgi:hypothetical protein